MRRVGVHRSTRAQMGGCPVDRAGRCAIERGRGGFSLIELLVVLGVVMVLIGLILPSLGGAKRRAEDVVQLRQINQLAGLVSLYAKDYDDAFPLTGDNQFVASASWYEPIIEAGLAESVRQIDEPSARRGLPVAFALSASMVSDRDYYIPKFDGRYPDNWEDRPASVVRVGDVALPSGKGMLMTWRVGYTGGDGTIPAAWCCMPGVRLVAPIAFADASGELLAYEDCFTSDPPRYQQTAGVPVYTTWHGSQGRDR